MARASRAEPRSTVLPRSSSLGVLEDEGALRSRALVHLHRAERPPAAPLPRVERATKLNVCGAEVALIRAQERTTLRKHARGRHGIRAGNLARDALLAGAFGASPKSVLAEAAAAAERLGAASVPKRQAGASRAPASGRTTPTAGLAAAGGGASSLPALSSDGGAALGEGASAGEEASTGSSAGSPIGHSFRRAPPAAEPPSPPPQPPPRSPVLSGERPRLFARTSPLREEASTPGAQAATPGATAADADASTYVRGCSGGRSPTLDRGGY